MCYLLEPMGDGDPPLAAFASKRILLTGGSGFMASNVVARLAGVNCRLVRIRRAGSPMPTDPSSAATIEHVEGDISEPDFWSKVLPGADIVYHFAAQTSVYQADQRPAEDLRSNVQPMISLLESCRTQGHQPLIVFAGTVTVFGLATKLPVDESQPPMPLSMYDWHKLLAEAHLEHYARQGWARGTTLRLANIYGPGPASGKADRGILNLMMRRALKGEALTLYGEGTQVRDYLYVTDAVDAFLAAALHPDAVNGRHFVLSSGEGHTLAEAFQLVADRAAILTGNKTTVVHVDPPTGLSRVEDRNFIGNTAQFRAATGWRPRTTLVQGIDATLRHFHSASSSIP
jgi:nucleoside-diphosphate-sugar epimerase